MRVAAYTRVPCRAVVEVLRPRIVAAKLQAVGEVAAQVHLEAVVEAGALRDPRGRIRDQRIRLDGTGEVDRACSECGGAGGVGAGDGDGFVLVLGEDLMVAVRADIADGERGVGSDLLLDLEVPREYCGSLDVGLHVRG